ncbi:MAG: DUF177 domain-containing protein [Clostridia bacterium]|nr:DUF177 domain-containing protein [Clostridia bacterium]
MRINLKDAFILDRYEKKIDFQLSAGKDEDLNTLAAFEKDPQVSFSIYGKYGLVMCDSVIDLEYTSYCSRCLAPVSGKLHIESRRRVITDPLKEDEDTILIEDNYMFYPDSEAKNQIILEFPERFLCADDCKGLCPVCGCNRNIKECGCEN